MSAPAASRAPSSAASSDPTNVLRAWLDVHQLPVAPEDVLEFLDGHYVALNRYRRFARGLPLEQLLVDVVDMNLRTAARANLDAAHQMAESTPDFAELATAIALIEREVELRRLQEEKEHAAREAEALRAREEELLAQQERERKAAEQREAIAKAAEARAASNRDDDVEDITDQAPAPPKDKGKKRKADDQSEADNDALSTVRVDLSHLQGVQRVRAQRAYDFWNANPVCDRCATGFAEVRKCVFVEEHNLKCDLCFSQHQACYYGGATFNGQLKLSRSGKGKKEKEEPLEVAVPRPSKRPRLEDGNLGGGSLVSFQGRVRELFGDFRSIPEAARTQAIALGTQARVRQAFEVAAARAEALTTQMEVLSIELSCVEAVRDQLDTLSNEGFEARQAELGASKAGPSRT
ncbi:uncharacterized protein C8Q71DRAFT_727010 [Rhodofomes roseus]|uniref:Uncharacterized protein n=1 Tax=Rhodofomes roseus TaxID=34475 RepID=A0ABQ8K3H8_9APHY|nr:uncharacterized protein C8Q71DRAFT_727010 [Rhodofomes roseus]KAH9831182.1 hypothetical protein C8Q71DRAFT_727010 [Rhodofomes roseus]